MSKLKSIEELQRIRQEAKTNINLRETAEDENRVIVKVGMATCGIACGARETFTAIADELKAKGITNVSLTQTGCLGYCANEPVVEVISNKMPSVIYGDVDVIRAKEIVNEHIIEGRLIQNAIITKSFEK